MEVWEDDLKTAASLHLDGVDCYQLNVFEKSPLARYIANGKLPRAATSDEKADFFAKSVEYFTSQNWRRLSNNHWGRTIRERNIYNAGAKSACDCLAFGCGAGGRLAGYSYMMERKLADYYRLLGEGRKPVAFGDGADTQLAPAAHDFLRNGVGRHQSQGHRPTVRRTAA